MHVHYYNNQFILCATSDKASLLSNWGEPEQAPYLESVVDFELHIVCMYVCMYVCM